MKSVINGLLGIVLVLLLVGCVTYDGPTVLISKGRAGFFQKIVGADGEFCKVAASEGVTLTEQDREAFRAYCQSDEQKIIEAVQRQQAVEPRAP